MRRLLRLCVTTEFLVLSPRYLTRRSVGISLMLAWLALRLRGLVQRGCQGLPCARRIVLGLGQLVMAARPGRLRVRRPRESRDPVTVRLVVAITPQTEAYFDRTKSRARKKA